MREETQRRHTHPHIRWVDDRLPALARVERRRCNGAAGVWTSLMNVWTMES